MLKIELKFKSCIYCPNQKYFKIEKCSEPENARTARRNHLLIKYVDLWFRGE